MTIGEDPICEPIGMLTVIDMSFKHLLHGRDSTVPEFEVWLNTDGTASKKDFKRTRRGVPPTQQSFPLLRLCGLCRFG